MRFPSGNTLPSKSNFRTQLLKNLWRPESFRLTGDHHHMMMMKQFLSHGRGPLLLWRSEKDRGNSTKSTSEPSKSNLLGFRIIFCCLWNRWEEATKRGKVGSDQWCHYCGRSGFSHTEESAALSISCGVQKCTSSDTSRRRKRRAVWLFLIAATLEVTSSRMTMFTI